MSENVAADIGLPGIQCDFGQVEEEEEEEGRWRIRDSSLQASEKTLLDRKDILDPVHLKEKRKVGGGRCVQLERRSGVERADDRRRGEERGAEGDRV
eukprot:766623-Hanusia_phi.AAC.1